MTINISNGGTVPTVTETGAGAVVVNNNVTVSVTVNDTDSVAIQNARVRVTATETVGTITSGDVIVEGLIRPGSISLFVYGRAPTRLTRSRPRHRERSLPQDSQQPWR